MATYTLVATCKDFPRSKVRRQKFRKDKMVRYEITTGAGVEGELWVLRSSTSGSTAGYHLDISAVEHNA